MNKEKNAPKTLLSQILGNKFTGSGNWGEECTNGMVAGLKEAPSAFLIISSND